MPLPLPTDSIWQPDSGGIAVPVNPNNNSAWGAGTNSLSPGGDPYFNSVVLLTPFSAGANGVAIPINTPGIDLSSYNHRVVTASGTGIGGRYRTTDDFTGLSVTRYGLPVAGSNTDGSIVFAVAGPLPEFLMGTGDFTIELDAAQQAFNTYDMSAFGVGSSGQTGVWNIGTGNGALNRARLAFYINSTSSVPAIMSSSNVWTESLQYVTIAYSRVAGIGYLFANGILVGSVADPTNYNTLNFQGPGQGQRLATLNAWRGFIANVRWTRGVGRYTSNYSPATAPYPTYSLV